MPRFQVLLAFVGLGLGAFSRPAEAARPPRLTVVVVVDQLATHALDRWKSVLTGGLARLIRSGAYYPQARYAYANTETGAGHSTLATGTWPEVHGIVGNRWIDLKTDREIYCFEDPAHWRSPKNLVVPTFADVLQMATSGAAKVWSIALKDRAAIAMGGQGPDGIAWYDAGKGKLIWGTWPQMKKPPAWLKRWQTEHEAARHQGKTWSRWSKTLDYDALAGPDDKANEYAVPGLGRTLPLVYGREVPVEQWLELYSYTPASLDDLMALAQTTFDEAGLGQDEVPDLLTIGISTYDYAGHTWGTRAHETLDILLRIDHALGAFMDHIETRLGQREVVFVVTADHGAVPPPEDVRALGLRARRVPPAALRETVRQAVGNEIKAVDVNAPMITLLGVNTKNRIDLRRRAARALAARDDILEAWAIDDLDRFSPAFVTLYRRSTYPGRNPDIFIRTAPHDYVSGVDKDGNGLGAGHGTPYVYDMAVPLIMSGPGIRPGIDRRPHPITRVAPTLAALWQISPPAAAIEAPLPAVTP